MIANLPKSTLDRRVSEEILPFVQQPGQYIGREINQLVEDGDWDAAAVRVAIAFPDTYTIGMSHLGSQILYWLANHTDGVCAERVFCPWLDAEQIMRDRGIELFTWDTRQPVRSADILAISLQYEMAFTSVLTLLDLAGIPFCSADRDDAHPLVIAGGPQADNPEPVADFLDGVVLGDGEASLSAILADVKAMKLSGVPRRQMLVEMAKRYEWFYVPSLYDVRYKDDGTVASIRPKREDIPATIVRCQTADFDEAPFPTRPLVPYTEVVHDRIGVEIMRGCPQRCRFCHAGYTKRPLRLRTPEKILEIAEEAYWATGQKEVGLLSLSTADYPHLRELCDLVHERFNPRMVNISVPSLRVDKMLENIPFMVNSVRKGGLTIAAEAARDDMRAAIRKKVADEPLIEGVRAAYRAGWRQVKLYFMAGFPGERPEDIDGIWDLSKDVSDARRDIGGAPAKVNASVSWLVPKPYTPLQWAAQMPVAYFHEVRRRLGRFYKGKKQKGAVKIKTHSPDRSILEGVFARGDRKLSAAVERAWQLGARLDGWDECFNNDIWMQAFRDTGINPAWYAHRERGYDEVLPWTHLQGGPPTEYLEGQYNDLYKQLSLPKRDTGLVPLQIA